MREERKERNRQNRMKTHNCQTMTDERNLGKGRRRVRQWLGRRGNVMIQGMKWCLCRQKAAMRSQLDTQFGWWPPSAGVGPAVQHQLHGAPADGNEDSGGGVGSTGDGVGVTGH